MSYILDGIVILIILFFIITSSKRGFVRTLIEVVGFVAALILAFTISSPLANATYDKMIEPSVVSAVENAANEGTQTAVDAAWGAMPKFITNNSDMFGLTQESFADKLTQSTADGITGTAISVSQNIAKPIVAKILGMIYSTLLVIVLLFVVKILAKIINKLFSFSIIGKLNRSLGGAIGLIKGLAIAVVFCMIISLIVSFTANGFLVFTRDAIDSSVIFKFLAGFSPFI